MPDDIRWKQRLANYALALARLSEAVDLHAQRALSDLEKQGLIQSFEFTHELAWNLMKDYFRWQGAADITGSRDAAREAFKQGLVADGELWMEMIASRNRTSHTYNRQIADEICQRILHAYHPAFVSLLDRMQALAARQ